MQIGKLYKSDENEFLTNVNYRLMGNKPANLWGELIPVEHIGINDSDVYLIELEDKNKIKCNLKKTVNRMVFGYPSRFSYRFTGS